MTHSDANPEISEAGGNKELYNDDCLECGAKGGSVCKDSCVNYDRTYMFEPETVEWRDH